MCSLHHSRKIFYKMSFHWGLPVGNLYTALSLVTLLRYISTNPCIIRTRHSTKAIPTDAVGSGTSAAFYAATILPKYHSNETKQHRVGGGRRYSVDYRFFSPSPATPFARARTPHQSESLRTQIINYIYSPTFVELHNINFHPFPLGPFQVTIHISHYESSTRWTHKFLYWASPQCLYRECNFWQTFVVNSVPVKFCLGCRTLDLDFIQVDCKKVNVELHVDFILYNCSFWKLVSLPLVKQVSSVYNCWCQR